MSVIAQTTTLYDKLGAFIFVFAIVAVVVSVIVLKVREKSALNSLAAHVGEYLSSHNLKQAIQEPYIIGKIVPVNRRVHLESTHPSVIPAGAIHDRIFVQLPSRLRASCSDEVGTIVWLDWEEHKVGEYKDGFPACVSICTVTIIDKKKQTIIHTQLFRHDPPETLVIGESGSIIQGLPNWDLKIPLYLASLPVK